MLAGPGRSVAIGSIAKKCRSVGTFVLTTLLLTGGTYGADGTAEFKPLCRDSRPGAHGVFDPHCWTPVANKPGCHFHGLLSLYDKTLAVSWSGACNNGRAVGVGVLTDEAGNRAEGRFVEGLKDGLWTRNLVNGMNFEEMHDKGVWSGHWQVTTASGVHLEGGYEESVQQGEWRRVWPDGYSEVGSYLKGRRHGTWTVIWPDGGEVVIPYVDGRIHGEVTVKHHGSVLGTLVYWKGERMGPGLPPVLLTTPADP